MGSIQTDVRPPRARIVWVGLALATFAGLLVLGRHLTFWQDEWAFIDFDPTGPASYLEPHNEHWSTVPLILYRSLLGVVGLQSYLPYLAVLAFLHVAAAGGAFVLLQRRLPGWAALLAALPLLVLGSGFENIFWAFQIGFVGSVAAGTWGLVALETDTRRWTAVAGVGLLIVGLASSGMGIFFVVAAGVRLFVDPPFRRRSIWVLVPAAVFAAWYLVIGRSGAGGYASPVDVARFAARGLTYAVSRVAGLDLAGRASTLGWIAGAAALLLVGVVFVRQALGRKVAPLALGGVVAAMTMYLVIGLTRADLPSDFATRSRYVYVAAFLLIPALGDLIASLASGRRLPRAGVAALIGLAIVSVGANVVDLRDGRAIFNRNAGLTRAYLTVLTDDPATSWPDPSMPLGWPDPERVAVLLDRYGSPLHDIVVPSNVRHPTKAQLERALVGLASGSFIVSADGAPPAGTPRAPTVLASTAAVVAPVDDACLSVTTSDTGSVTVAVPDGGHLVVAGPLEGATVTLGRARPPSPRSAKPLPPSTTGSWTIAVPQIRGDTPWQVKLDIPEPATVRVCGFGP